ncbi:MAG TPA: S41 family peptidase [Vicinamibacteria bacterium]|nr:S41 family peptidase [Vicinamibacteria bacterium]
MPLRARALLLALLVSSAAPAGAGEARFMTYPDVRGDRIVFAWEGDLYTVGVEGGTATRLTGHPASELAPKFSPDGTWIAYSTSQDGQLDVWVMPSEGGAPTRLTWPPLGGQVVAWTPDSRRVVFRSRFGVPPVARDQKLYEVGLDASLPEPLPIDRGQRCSFSPDGSKMLYVRKGNEDYYWKRYKGGQYTDIWTYDFGARTFAAVTDYVGRNAYPMWIGDTMYFSSDRSTDGVTNLWAQDLKTGALRQVTSYSDFDLMSPSSDGRRIVFVQNGYLNVLDTAGGAPRRVPVRIPSDDWRLQDRWINPSDYVQFVDVGGDGKTVVLAARGDVFHLAVSEKETLPRNLTRTPGVREDTPRLSPDGKKIAYFSDATGEYQLYVRDVATGETAQLTTDLDRKVYHPRWSPDGKKILFGDKDFSLFFVDLATKKRTKIDESRYLDNDEFTWEVSDYAWSPDSRFVAYSLPRENRNNAIFLYDTLQGRRVQLTDDFFENLNPRFDADGGYLYFLSYRNFQIGMDPFEDDHIVANPARVMVVQLRKGEKPPFVKRGATEPAAPSASSAEKDGEKKDDPARFRLDTDGIQSRVYALPVDAGNDFHLLAGKGYVAWSSVPLFTEDEYEEIYAPGGKTKWTFHVFSMKDEKEVSLDDKIAEAQASVNGEALVFRKDAAVFVSSFAKAYETKKLGTEVDLSGMTYRVSPREEWRQIFADAWRWYRDFFYDKDMHGRDWKAIRAKYAPYVEDVRTRQQLNWVLSEMVGELSVSHTYISGGDTGPSVAPPAPAVSPGLLGADLVADPATGLYRFARVYGPTPYFTEVEAPLARPDVDVKEGDSLLAIDGQPVKVPENYFRRLQVGKSDEVALTVGRGPKDPAPRTYRVKPAKSDRDARYARWVTDNVLKVLRLSNGDVGYMHVTAMGGGGVMEFDKFWRAFRYKKGLVIDVRGNNGGWTEYFLIDKLERRQVAFNVLKGMEPYRYPNPASRAHLVLLSNEDNGSDGEAFVEHFKARQLGTVVGVPSWGGLVGIVNGQRTIDNGRVEQSNNAFYGREGKWLVENHGADPDVVQDDDPASVTAGRDLQLEKAVEVALRKIREQPWQFPPVPPYPRK